MRKVVIVVLLGVGLLLLIRALLSLGPGPSSSDSSYTSSPYVGEVGHLCDPKGGNVLVAKSREGWDKMAQAAAAGDREGFNIAAIQYGVFLPNGLQVRIIDRRGIVDSIVKFRVIDEEDPNYGRTFWTSADWVCR